MKKLVPLALLALATSTCAWSQTQSQPQSPSLGDVARQQRNTEKPSAHKVWTDDDFASTSAPVPDQVKTVDGSPASEEAGATDASGEKAAKVDVAKDGKAATKKKSDLVEDQQKLDAEWKGKVDAQKQKVADLKREYDLTDRETRLQATTYYADAGNALRSPKDFQDKQKLNQDKLTTLKQQIDEESTKLTELQEQARKAGAKTE